MNAHIFEQFLYNLVWNHFENFFKLRRKNKHVLDVYFLDVFDCDFLDYILERIFDIFVYLVIILLLFASDSDREEVQHVRRHELLVAVNEPFVEVALFQRDSCIIILIVFHQISV